MQHQRHLHHNNIASHTPRLPFHCQGNASHNSWITVPPASQLHWHLTLTPATGALLRHQFAVRTGRAWRVRPPPSPNTIFKLVVLCTAPPQTGPSNLFSPRFFIDQDQGMAYFYPPAPITAGSVFLSLAPAAVVASDISGRSFSIATHYTHHV
jgi:hypothetical protein